MTARAAHVWTTLCPFDMLTPERGVAALVDVFSLATGRCLDNAALAVPTYPIRCNAGIVEVTVGAA